MTATTISFRADEQTMAELRQLGGDGNLSDAILLSTLIVASTSTSAQPAIFRPEIEIDGSRTLVLVDQMRAADAKRLGDFAGRLDAVETGEVDRVIKLILGTSKTSHPPGLAIGTSTASRRYRQSAGQGD